MRQILSHGSDCDKLRMSEIKDNLEKLIEEKGIVSGLKYLFSDEILNVNGF